MTEITETTDARQKVAAIADWQGRARKAFGRLNGAHPARIEAAFERWCIMARQEVEGSFPLAALVGFAHAALPEARADHPAALRINRMFVFAAGLRADGVRIHHTYLDRLLESDMTDGLYRIDIEAEAFRLGRCDGFQCDPAEAYHAAVLTFLLKRGQKTSRRSILTDPQLAALHREIILDDARSVIASDPKLGRAVLTWPNTEKIH